MLKLDTFVEFFNSSELKCEEKTFN